MEDGGLLISRALDLSSEFLQSLKECGVLHSVNVEYEAYAEITEDTYVKFVELFHTLALNYKALHESMLGVTFSNTESQTDKKLTCDKSCAALVVDKANLYTITDNHKQQMPSLTPKFDAVVNKVEILQKNKYILSNVIPNRIPSNTREVITCDYCDNMFETLEESENHKKLVHNEDFSKLLYGCSNCSEHFLSLEALFEHNSCVHKDNNAGYNKMTQEDLVEDVTGHLCPYCGDIEFSWNQLSDHLLKIHNVHICKICNITCETKDKLQLHINTVHETGIDPEIINKMQPTTKNDNLSTSIEKNPVNSSGKKRGRPRKIVPAKSTEPEISAGVICSICKVEFQNSEKLKRHLQFSHTNILETSVQCPKCKLKFKRRPALENHLKIVHNKHDDEDDTGETDSSKKLQQAYNVSPAATATTSTNYIAPKQKTKPVYNPPPITSSAALFNTSIIKSTQRQIVSRLHCEVCGEVCLKAEDQEIHRDHHATRRRDYFLCLYCEVAPMKQHELRAHIISEHRYRCPFCSLTFWWKVNLENHLNQLHRSKDTCPTCHFKSEVDDLRQHVLMNHAPRKLYLCKTCNKELPSVKEMHEHEIIHTKNSNTPMLCNFCQRTFWNRRCLKGHLLRHLHGSFYCYLCGHQFQTEKGLYDHMMRHKNSQFACFCGARFAQKIELTKHQRSNICRRNKKPALILPKPIEQKPVFVSVPKVEEDIFIFNEIPDIKKQLCKLQLSDIDKTNNIVRININENPAQHSSKDFIGTLARSMKNSQELYHANNERVFILNTDLCVDDVEFTEILPN